MTAGQSFFGFAAHLSGLWLGEPRGPATVIRPLRPPFLVLSALRRADSDEVARHSEMMSPGVPR
jgi:hypothetical protein